MSFGASSTVRFDNVGGGPHRPVIFWQQQQQQQESSLRTQNKKFKYLGKGQKFTLRDRKPAPAEVIHAPPAKKPANHVKNSQRASKAPSTETSGGNKKKTPKTAGTVVLTQKEFDAILETIGQLAIEAEDNKLGVSQNEGHKHEDVPSKDINTEAKPQHTESKHVQGRTTESSQPEVSPAAPEPAPALKPQVKRDNAVVEPVSVPGLSLSPTQSVAPVAGSPEQPLEGLRRSVLAVPKAHLTKAERKRLEWERQKAEENKQEEWSPWGRPGAGAPIKDKQGNVLTDYVTRKRVTENRDASHPPAPPAATVSPPYKHNEPTRPANDPPPPAAIRSSFTIGNPEPNENRFMSAKERERKLWLEELDKQRQEQQKRRQSEKDHTKQEELPDTWADRFIPPKVETDHQVSGQTPFPAENPQEPERTTRVVSAPVNNQAKVAVAEQHTSPRSYIRGQNIQIDSATLRELEEKRQKQQQHQEYIRQQIEEKERLKREERERRRREEQEEEEKLRREREEQQNQLQREKDKQREKENVEQQRLDALKQAMEEAQEEAERQKHEKRLRKLQRAGHDVSHLHATFEAKMTPRVPGATSVTRVEPSHIPGLTPRDAASLPDNIAGFSTSPHGYHMDMKQGHSSAMDLNQSPRTQLEHPADLYTRESTSVEYEGPLLEKKKKVRVKSAHEEVLLTPPESAAAPVKKKKRPLKLEERPKWGHTNPQKKAVKQSERDPFYIQRQREKEMKRAQRQEMMQKMAHKHSPRVSEATTVASRARSRSRDRDESPSHDHRSRSRSPPPDLYHSGHRRQSRSPHRPVSPPESVQHNNPPSRNSSPGFHLRSTSPPIPALKHRKVSDNNPDTHNYDNSSRLEANSRNDNNPSRNRYLDQNIVNPPLHNGQFVPFIRSSNILDPAHAESPMPVSREPSLMEKARKAYIQEHDPAKFGFVMDNYKDDMKSNVGPQQPQKPHRRPADPILDPSLVTEYPSGRQNQILQQLSDLRRGLMQKQRELEVEAE